MTIKGAFAKLARAVASAMGSPHAFVLALLAVVVWAAVGPLFDFSSQWQLVINTGTTIITFLVVFIIQSTQNKDAKAVHLKLDELIHVIDKARNRLIDCEDLPDDELAKLDREFQELRKHERLRTIS
jgi:low affinity Fe/Cu permease